MTGKTVATITWRALYCEGQDTCRLARADHGWLLVGGGALAFIPGLPEISLDPELVLVLFLPPLLFLAIWAFVSPALVTEAVIATPAGASLPPPGFERCSPGRAWTRCIRPGSSGTANGRCSDPAAVRVCLTR